MAADYLRYYPQDYGNQRTWTFSGWIKKTKQETNQNLLSPRYGGDGNPRGIHWKSYGDLKGSNKKTAFSFQKKKVYQRNCLFP